MADYLIDILRTSKSDFERTTMLWKKFNARMGIILSCWLDEIGAKPKIPETDVDLCRMSAEIEKSINQVLKMPEFEKLVNTLFQNIVHRDIAIRNNQGALLGSEADGKQQTSGSLGGQGTGEGIETAGDEEGNGIIVNENGEIPIEKIQRRVRGLVKIGYEEKPEDALEGWMDPGKKAIIINRGHPAWKIANGLSLQARDERVRVYHVLRTVFSTLVEEGITDMPPRETLAKLFSSWYDSWVKG